MDFKKYNSIENSYRAKFINKIIEEGHGNKEYIVQEKIHGANFSFWIDEAKIKCGKRSGFIGEEGSFNNFQSVLKKHYQDLRLLYSFLATSRGAKEVAIFGEIYGGHYPHQDVEAIAGMKKVQGEVYYRPDVAFVGFDMMVDGIYLDVDDMNSLMVQFNLPYAETLFRGSLEDALKYSNEFEPTIPKLLGFPSIKDNICEGVVIRPTQTTYIYDGCRVIIKNKNDKFKENDAEPKDFKDKDKKLTDEATAVVQELSTYISENRLRNVLSKIGPVTQKDFGKILGFYNKDILEDFMKDHGDKMESLDKDMQHRVNREMGRISSNVVRKNFVNILDNNF